MSVRLLLPLTLCATILAGCKEPHPLSPVCRVDRPQPHIISARAACLVRLDDKLLILSDERTETFRLPASAPLEQESGQCAAHRVMWEVTGLNVQVGQLLGESDDGTQFFNCTLDASFDEPFTDWPLPDWSPTKDLSLTFKDPFEMTINQWESGQELVKVRRFFNQAGTAN